MRPKHLPVLLMLAGLVIMAAASGWAPPQPELFVTGACQIAPCGMLEDPARWRAAWWLWSVGLIVLIVGSVMMVRPLPPLRPSSVLLAALAFPMWLVITGVFAILVAFFTSVHGAATVAAVSLLTPALALVAATVKRHAALDPTSTLLLICVPSAVAVRELGARQAAACGAMTPVAVAISAIWLLDEIPDLSTIVAPVLIVIGTLGFALVRDARPALGASVQPRQRTVRAVAESSHSPSLVCSALLPQPEGPHDAPVRPHRV